MAFSRGPFTVYALGAFFMDVFKKAKGSALAELAT